MDGVLIIDKAAGVTSHDVVSRVRRILGERRVGHTGTLDPFATGVLVILIGRATRLAQFLSGAEKKYEAVIRLGYATDTGDLTGTPVTDRQRIVGKKTGLSSWSDEEIESALASLRGKIDQVPPMYSAKKYKGERLYELARRGEEIKRQPVSVVIRELEAVRRSGLLLTGGVNGTCDLAVRVVCSAGTYIRTLAEEFGVRLGVGAHLVQLRRTGLADFQIENAQTLDELQRNADEGTVTSVVLPAEAALSGMPFLHLRADDALRARHGRAVRVGAEARLKWLNGEKVGLRDEDGSLIAVGAYDAAGQLLQPRVVIAAEK